MAKPAPSGTQTTTTFQVGTYTATSDTWTQVIDLNDQSTIWLMQSYPQMPQPEKVRVSSFNVRTPGEAIQRVQYKNRHIKIAISIRGNAAQSIVNTVHSLIGAVNNPPYTLRIALPKTAQYSYADVQNCVHDIPTDPLKLQQLAIVKATLDFECYPYLRGDRLVLQNLAVNPGFEAPSGPAVNVFADAFANVNAYAVQSGSTPTTGPSNAYTDAVFANIPASGAVLRYFRLGLADDATHAYDSAGTGATGTPTASPTQQVAGLVSGDTDTCYTFASASSQWVSVPVTGLPTGNSAVSFFCRFKEAANPAAIATLMSLGSALTTHNILRMFVTTAGKLACENANTGTGTITGATTITTGAAHDACVTWDSTTLTLYLDGVSQGTATPGAQTVSSSGLGATIGVTSGSGNYFNGQIDEVCFYSGALSGAQVTALHNAGATGATGTVANAASFAAASRVSFGTPNWGAINTWALRFRYATSQVGTYYLHYTDANNNLAAQVASGANGFTLVHKVAGVATTIAQATAAPLQHEAWYWLQVTQFPFLSGNTPQLSVTLSYDNAGTVGATISTISGFTTDAVTALSGKPQIAPTGAALVLGGLASGAGHSVGLFGPGAWTFQTAGTGPAFGAWEQTSNLYANGPVTSYGAARIDANATGTLDAKWRLFTGGSPTYGWAIPVAAAGDVIFAGVNVKSSNLGNGATLKLEYTEYDLNGNSLRTGTLQTFTVSGGVQAAYAAALSFTVSGTWTTGASCAYVDLAIHAADTVAANSANAIVWADNCQVYDQTSTGQTSMPYCELRFPQAPAQLIVTGLLGDAPSGCLLALGTFSSSPVLAGPQTLEIYAGRRGQSGDVGPLAGNIPNAQAASSVVASTAYGGWYQLSPAVSGAGFTAFDLGSSLGQVLTNLKGTYHSLARLQSRQTTGNIANVYSNVQVRENLNGLDGPNLTANAAQVVLTVGQAWQTVDLGLVNLPPSPQGSLQDPSKVNVRPQLNWEDLTGGGSVAWFNSFAYVPVDSSVVIATFYIPTAVNGGPAYWSYIDGTTPSNPNWTWNSGVNAVGSGNFGLANPAQGLGGTGTLSSTGCSVNPASDPFLTLDPSLTGANSAYGGVNQIVVSIADGSTSGALPALPVLGELQYSPLYLYPR